MLLLSSSSPLRTPLRKLLVIATYGHAGDNLATAHVAHATGLNWVTLGGYDYNITQEESPMARALLALPCRCLDDAFLWCSC